MSIKTRLVLLSLVGSAGVSMMAHAWSVQEDHGSWALIRCDDGSNSKVEQSNGVWTVVSAGNNGKAGGQFAIIGQAALWGCGPE
jgi:hypothetical protein